MNSLDLVLASASPRRRQLLEQLGLRVDIRPADINEDVLDGEDPRSYTQRLAQEKSAAVREALALTSDSAELHALPILAADTTVVVDRRILGKPDSPEHARQMLDMLCGRRHEVITAYAITYGERSITRAVSTFVTMRLATDAEKAAYVACREWDGKAGGYAIQGIAAAFVSDVRGSLTNVIGLPLAEVLADLRALEAIPNYPRAAFGGEA